MFESLNVLKEMFSVQQATIELWMHTGGLLSTQEARVALGYSFVRLLATFVRSSLPRASITRWLRAKHYLIMEHIEYHIQALRHYVELFNFSFLVVYKIVRNSYVCRPHLLRTFYLSQQIRPNFEANCAC